MSFSHVRTRCLPLIDNGGAGHGGYAGGGYGVVTGRGIPWLSSWGLRREA